jgi:ATP-binding cassette subfamily B protein
VQLFGAEKKSEREFGAASTSLLTASLREIYIFGIFRPSVEFIATLTTAVVLAAGAVFVLRLSLSLGVLIAFINLVAMFYAPVMDIAEKYTMLQAALAGAERVFMLLDTNEQVPDTAAARPAGAAYPPVKGDIRFNNVRFSYESGGCGASGRCEVLKGLSFSVPAGQTAAITGLSGAGKTTVTNLISRLWDIDSGEILLDGVDIRALPLDYLRRAALPVLQDVFLFSLSVADNISLGLPLSRAEIEQAARAAAAHDFITRLPEGYDTMLSEGASNVSQGQRQLISFARVVAHNPPIVILDEATSSIDTETEHAVQRGLARVLAGRTSIVIAHRLSTIRNAETILVLANGVVAEAGTHARLVEKGGLYASLYKLQFEGSGGA